MNYVSRAEHALRTGQPNLAVLYLRRGISESARGRAWLARYDLGTAMVAAHAKSRIVPWH
jgi:hypothetical protein